MGSIGADTQPHGQTQSVPIAVLEIGTELFSKASKEGFFVVDMASGIPLLLDSGASRSVIPLNLCHPTNRCETVMRSVTGDTLKVAGKSTLKLDIGLGRELIQEFIVADIPTKYGVLGYDFLDSMNICFMTNPPRLLDKMHHQSIELKRSSKDPMSINHLLEGQENVHANTEVRELPCPKPTECLGQCIRHHITQSALPRVPSPTFNQKSPSSINYPSFSSINHRLPKLSGITRSPSMGTSSGHLGKVESHCVSAQQRCEDILNEFPEVTAEPRYDGKPKHNFTLDINLTDDTPFYQKPRRCADVKRRAIIDHFEGLATKGAVVKRASEYASPITVVTKKDGRYRVCVDYTNLNRRTEALNYPLPLISTLHTLVRSQHRYFSVLDLKDAYLALPLTPRASERAGIVTLDGLYVPLRCPFGLKNAPFKYCELIDTVIDGLKHFVFSYLDDFLVFSETLEEHYSHLGRLLTRLRDFGLYVNAKKCVLAKESVKFLGHEVSSEGLHPLHHKVSLVATMERPKTLKKLRRFLGIVGYYREHVKEMAKIAQPLTNLLKGEKKNSAKILRQWGDTEQEAYDQVIRALQDAETLGHEDPNCPLILSTDASLSHAGATLEQSINRDVPDGSEGTRPLAYFSKAFPASVRDRSTFNRELTAMYMAVRFFKHRLRGRNFIIRTDHASLVNAFNNKEGEHSPHERRMLLNLCEYQCSIIHIKGEQNAVADALSRPMPEETVPKTVWNEDEVCREISVESSGELSTLSKEGIADAQTKDPSFMEESLPEGVVLHAELLEGERSLWGVLDVDGAEGSFRPWIPIAMRPQVFQTLHNTIHQGAIRTTDTIAARYFWPTMSQDIKLWVKCCPKCQKSKVTRHNRQTLQNFPGLTPRLQIFHVDLMGPLVESGGYKYVLTMRDRGTGFLVTAPLPDKTSLSVVTAIRDSLVANFGVPATLITDNGREFCSALFTKFCGQLNIKHQHTTSYHPQANGLVERVHRVIKVAFSALDDPTDWANHLPLVQLMLNNQICDRAHFTPFQMAFGQAANLPGAFVGVRQTEPDEPATLNELLIFFQNMQFHQREARALPVRKAQIENDLYEVDMVLVRIDHARSPLSPRYQGPFLVTNRHLKYFTVMCDAGPKNISVDRLKAYHTLPSVSDEFSEGESSSEECDSDEETE